MKRFIKFDSNGIYLQSILGNYMETNIDAVSIYRVVVS